MQKVAHLILQLPQIFLFEKSFNPTFDAFKHFC
jgi:hypothetical protein